MSRLCKTNSRILLISQVIVSGTFHQDNYNLLFGTVAETLFFPVKNFCLLATDCFELIIINVLLIWFQLFGWLFCRVHPGAVVFAVLAAMSIQGSANLQTQWNIVGEFSNLPQEELIEWIKYSTKPGKNKTKHIIQLQFPLQFYIPLQNPKTVISNGIILSKQCCFQIIQKKRDVSLT